ncbi:MAG: flap endonuclease [Pseudomonadales bacterium]|nr:flap endonuclease [Pseudomonadales bacterium]
MKRLHVIDGTYELYRAHYSKRPSKFAPDGQDVKGTAGVVSSLLGLLADQHEKVTHIAVAFDNPIESFRNDLFAGYKTGEGMEPVLVEQMELVEEAVAALGMVVWSMAEFEADDALATAAVKYRSHVDQVRIMTADKDLGQSVDGDAVIQVDRMRDRIINEQGVVERNGVLPKSIPDWLGLVGDTADGIPGLAGFGAKSAATLLTEYGEIEAIPDDPDSWSVKVRGAPRLAETLARERSEALLYKQLATLRLDVPLAESIDELEWRGAPRQQFNAFAERLGGITMRPKKFID